MCDGNCACGRNLITFKLVNEKQIDVYRNGEKVGEIWTWKPKNHPLNQDVFPYSNRDKDYNENNGIQICGFTEASEIWTCGNFEDRKDMVIVFNGNTKMRSQKME